MPDATQRVESEEDEWVSDPSIRLAEELVEGAILWNGEKRDVQEIGVVVSKDVWLMRERAASAAGDLVERQSSVARVVLADCVVDYMASESKGDVWGDYRQDAGEESVSGFLEWVSARQFCRVLADQGVELFPEFTGRVDVGQRTAKDTLDALRNFRNLED